MLPYAIQYGMTAEQFWFGELNLFTAYQKAYMNKLMQESYVMGGKVYEAMSIVMNNAFSGSQGKKLDYPKELPDIIGKELKRQKEKVVDVMSNEVLNMWC